MYYSIHKGIMIIPVKCFTCQNVISDKYMFFILVAKKEEMEWMMKFNI